jgi:carboxypeptidase Q
MRLSFTPRLPTAAWSRRLVGWLGVTALAAVVTAASFTRAQAPAASPAEALDQKIMAEAKSGSEIMANLGYLSDVIGPRLTGSAAVKRAGEWAADKMRSYGLTNVRLEPWTIPMGWERGPATARILEPNNGRSLLIASMGWSPGTKGKIQGDVVVVNAKNQEELNKYKGKLKDAIVLTRPPAQVSTQFESGRRGGRPGAPGKADDAKGEGKADAKGDAKAPAPGLPSGKQLPGFSRGDRPFMDMAFRRELTEFLRTEGAALMVQDAGKPHGLLTTTGGWRGQDRASANEPIPAVYMAHEHYALLYRLATRPEPARTRVEIEIQNKLIPGPIPVYNVVGELRGSEKPDEYVVLGAHLDSWDLAQGTTDNGTGTSIVLEAARILARCGVPPKRTIRFCLFTGEEQGLYGSRAFCEQHKDEMPRTSVCIIHDTGTGKVQGLGLNNREVLKPILEKEFASLKEIGFSEINLRGGMGGSDHASFERADVPGFMLQQDMTGYNLTHHSQSDTFDKVQEANLVQGAQVMAVMGMRVANLPELLPRDKPKGSDKPFGGRRREQPAEKPVEKKDGR